MPHGQFVDPLAVGRGGEQRSSQDDEAHGVPVFHHRKRVFEVLYTADAGRHQRHPQPAGGLLRGMQPERIDRRGGVEEHPDPPALWQDRCQQLQVLPIDLLTGHDRYSRDVAPGHARLWTSPRPTGSSAVVMTIGTFVVVCCTASAARLTFTTNTSTWRSASSAASAG